MSRNCKNHDIGYVAGQNKELIQEYSRKLPDARRELAGQVLTANRPQAPRQKPGEPVLQRNSCR